MSYKKCMKIKLQRLGEGEYQIIYCKQLQSDLTGLNPGSDANVCSDGLHRFVLKTCKQNAYGVEMR